MRMTSKKKRSSPSTEDRRRTHLARREKSQKKTKKKRNKKRKKRAKKKRTPDTSEPDVFSPSLRRRLFLYRSPSLPGFYLVFKLNFIPTWLFFLPIPLRIWWDYRKISLVLSWFYWSMAFTGFYLIFFGWFDSMIMALDLIGKFELGFTQFFRRGRGLF